MHECWPGSPELLELVAAKEGLGKWMGFASLARATDGAPEVAKYCLNEALLARVRRRKTGHGGTNFFTARLHRGEENGCDHGLDGSAMGQRAL